MDTGSKQYHAFLKALHEVEKRLKPLQDANVTGKVLFTFHIEGGTITRFVFSRPGLPHDELHIKRNGDLLGNLGSILQTRAEAQLWCKVEVFIWLREGVAEDATEGAFEEIVSIQCR